MSKMVAVEKELAVMEICPPRGRQCTSARGKITVGLHSNIRRSGTLRQKRAFFARFPVTSPCASTNVVQPGAGAEGSFSLWRCL